MKRSPEAELHPRGADISDPNPHIHRPPQTEEVSVDPASAGGPEGVHGGERRCMFTGYKKAGLETSTKQIKVLHLHIIWWFLLLTFLTC